MALQDHRGSSTIDDKINKRLQERQQKNGRQPAKQQQQNDKPQGKKQQQQQQKVSGAAVLESVAKQGVMRSPAVALNGCLSDPTVSRTASNRHALLPPHNLCLSAPPLLLWPRLLPRQHD